MSVAIQRKQIVLYIGANMRVKMKQGITRRKHWTGHAWRRPVRWPQRQRLVDHSRVEFSLERMSICTHPVYNVGRNFIGDKSFYVTAPRLWNALPRNIREAKSLTVFKKMLKSHLYPNYWLVLCLHLHFFHLALWFRWKDAFTNVYMYVIVCTLYVGNKG